MSARVTVTEPYRVVIDGTVYTGGDTLEVDDADAAHIIANGWADPAKANGKQ
jgi:hypothetical protein